MSKPAAEAEPLYGAVQEIISAMSALNMYPEPREVKGDEAGWLAHSDAWANHSMEHLVAAMRFLDQARRERSKMLSEAIRFLEQTERERNKLLAEIHHLRVLLAGHELKGKL